MMKKKKKKKKKDAETNKSNQIKSNKWISWLHEYLRWDLKDENTF